MNGQAPPGCRTLEDVGRWRCGGCGAWNGREKAKEEVAKLVRGWEEERREREKEVGGRGSDDGESEEGSQGISTDEGDGGDVKEEEEEAVVEKPVARSTRSRAKGKGRK